ncbi:dihydrofolate reductase family protein [Actinomadura sp. WMMA1423]|uniref:dihydrofolate reductase family protein n=1 Tax=Actinomadura sp. WMMA1423 TaxID=2591108 RepID=UPI00114656C1|nr:dihydrofolate reductase family protein [Actinomadura sp. WMMA1423]
MRRLVYYVAATLDGYIAGPDGQYDFLPFEGEPAKMIVDEYPETLPAHVRGPLGIAAAPNRHFDAVVMGRGTYEPALTAGITSPYPHLEQYVVSTTLGIDDPAVTVVAEDPAGLVRELKRRDGLDIWLAGGGRLAGALVDEIDALVVKRHPMVIGSGIPLFDGPFAVAAFTPGATRAFDSGLVVTTYTRAADSGVPAS